ncbi:hypothetical protein V6Z93_010082 [Aspergillus fumigatus]
MYIGQINHNTVSHTYCVELLPQDPISEKSSDTGGSHIRTPTVKSIGSPISTPHSPRVTETTQKCPLTKLNTTQQTPPSPNSPPRRRRPDLSTFFSTLSQISPDEHRSRPHAVPVPRDVSAAFYTLAEALEVMRRESEGGGASAGSREGGNGDGDGDDLLSQMIQTLLREADTPPKEVEGVSEEFCDSSARPGTTYVVEGDADLPDLQ